MAAKAPRPLSGSPGVQDWTGSSAGRTSTGASPDAGRNTLADRQNTNSGSVGANKGDGDKKKPGDSSGTAESN